MFRIVAMALALSAAPAAAQSQSDSYAFLKAVESGDGDKVNSILAKPGSTVVNARSLDGGEGGLHIAVRQGQLNWVRFLLAKGARADLQDDAGNTPLMLAAQEGFFEAAEVLLRGGANVNATNSKGETPLIVAVHRRDLPMVRLLMGKGGDPNRSDSAAGLSALDYAKRDGRMPAIVEALEAKPEPKREVAGPTF